MQRVMGLEFVICNREEGETFYGQPSPCKGYFYHSFNTIMWTLGFALLKCLDTSYGDLYLLM